MHYDQIQEHMTFSKLPLLLSTSLNISEYMIANIFHSTTWTQCCVLWMCQISASHLFMINIGLVFKLCDFWWAQIKKEHLNSLKEAHILDWRGTLKFEQQNTISDCISHNMRRHLKLTADTV